MKARALLLSAFFVLAVPLFARANSIASVVVRPDGEVLFSDYRGSRIWGVKPGGVARVVLAERHTHHLALGPDASVWGEHVTPDGSIASLWSLDRDGKHREVLAPRRRPDPAAVYEGTVFAIEGDELVFLRGCQIMRGRVGGNFRVWSGAPCGTRPGTTKRCDTATCTARSRRDRTARCTSPTPGRSAGSRKRARSRPWMDGRRISLRGRSPASASSPG